MRRLMFYICAALNHGTVVNADSHPSLRHRTDHAPTFICLRCKGTVQ